jgi:hypothetical protein
MILQASKLPKGDFWMPNWRFDALCVRVSAAEDLLRRFRVRTLPVHTPKSKDTGIVQLVPTVSDGPLYDRASLHDSATARHGEAGQICPQCGTWRWLPLGAGDLPVPVGLSEAPNGLIASSELFGTGMRTFRALMFQRPLAEALTRLNPRVWSVVEPAR